MSLWHGTQIIKIVNLKCNSFLKQSFISHQVPQNVFQDKCMLSVLI